MESFFNVKNVMLEQVALIDAKNSPNIGFIDSNEDFFSMVCEVFVDSTIPGSLGNRNSGFEINKTPLAVNRVAIR